MKILIQNPYILLLHSTYRIQMLKMHIFGMNTAFCWARKNFVGLGWAWILTANCGPGLGSNYRPMQGTNVHPYTYRDFLNCMVLWALQIFLVVMCIVCVTRYGTH